MTQIERLYMLYEFIRENTGKNVSYSFKDFYKEKLKQRLRPSEEAKARKMWARDINELKDIGIKVVERVGKWWYEIEVGAESQDAVRTLEFAYQFELRKKKNQFNQFIRFEKRIVKGINHFTDFLEAIRAEDLTEFKYENYLRATIDKIEFYPYNLVQSKSRWYAIGVKNGGSEIFALCLDRISDFKVIENQKREGVKANFNIDEYYKDCMGVYNRTNLKVQTIKLETNKFQAKYIEAFPIHSSQVIREGKNDGMIIELKMKITPEVILEIAQYGHKIKVLKPESLRNYLIKVHEEALKVLKSESRGHLIEEEFLIK